jgi:homospermidine synthase
MSLTRKHCAFGGRLVIVGFGSIGQGSLPLILRHIDIDRSRITIMTAEERGQAEAKALGIRFVLEPLTADNYRSVLEPLIGPGDFLLNVSQRRRKRRICVTARPGLDAGVEVERASLAAERDQRHRRDIDRSNYALRESALALRGQGGGPGGRGPTALLTHGANPGLVSHFVKKALLDIANDTGLEVSAVPADRPGWVRLARGTGVSVIHIAERDTQVANVPKRIGEFVNTWSIDGFCSEGRQPSELGWGSHERHFPADGARHAFGCDSAIYL